MRSRKDPTLPPIENPYYGFWAPHITKVNDIYRMYYSQASYEVTFNDDGSLGGELSGTWSSDETSQTLSVNNNDLIVDTAWNWEASQNLQR